jgi:hypothetical protein
VKSLVELQIAFQKAVRDRNASAELIRLVREQPPLSTRERLHVYQEAYEVRLKESLRDDFGRVRAQLSFEQFEGLISSFISAHPSTSRNLAEYSEGFVDFVRKNASSLFLEALKDWMEIASENAGAPDQLTHEQIQSGTPFRVKAHPASLYKSTEPGNGILAYRHSEQTHFVVLDERKARLLDYLTRERSLDEIAEFTHTSNPGLSDEQLMATITEWIQNQIIYCLEAT